VDRGSASVVVKISTDALLVECQGSVW